MRLVRVASLIATILAGMAAAGDLQPPLVGMKPHPDPRKLVSIDLPDNWTDLGPDTNTWGAVQHWSGWIQKPQPGAHPDAHIQVGVEATYARAELAAWSLQDQWPGKLVEGSVRRGDGWVEQVRQEPERSRHYLFRVVEGKGQVFELAAYCHDSIWVHIENHLRALLDTFQVTAKWPDEVPESFARSQEGVADVRTDTKDKKTLKRIVDAHAAGFAAAAKLLPGDRFITDAPLVVVFEKDAPYTAYAANATPVTAPVSVLDYRRRAFCARVSGKNHAQFALSNQQFAALQYCQQYFGGKAPDWAEHGIALLAVASLDKGKLEKPPAEFLQAAKQGVAARRARLIDELDEKREAVGGGNAISDFDACAFAWHWWMRLGPGKAAYGDAYDRYLADLRESGSPEDAKKAWKDVDMDKMAAEFQAWVAKWK